jgi:hypothetical protein
MLNVEVDPSFTVESAESYVVAEFPTPGLRADVP